MGHIRQFLRNHRRLALACALLALALRVLVPSGMMLAPAGHSIAVQICADASGTPKLQQIVLPGKSPAERPHDAQGAGPACPYAALSMAALGGADIILLAAALALLMVLGLAAVIPPRCATPQRLRPPLRAPPIFA